MKADNLIDLKKRAGHLRMFGLVANWEKFGTQDWIRTLIEAEEVERARRSREYRIRQAKIAKFKDRVDFDWNHPSSVERAQVEELFSLEFIRDGQNVVFLGPNGVGKTMLAANLAQTAVESGISTRYTTASDMLNDLASFDGSVLRHRMRRYISPELLVVDELGYLSYGNRHGDLLFQVVSRRYENQAPIILTTNKPFAEWNTVFEGSSCVSTMIDRLCHRIEIVQIDGESYRRIEGQKRSSVRRKSRKPAAKSAPKTK